MSVVIYISGKQLQIVCAKGTGQKAKVTDAYVVETPEGSVINGTVMDTDAFIPFMKEFFLQNKIPTKDVSLVINSRKIAGKNLDVPVMNSSKTFEFITREFADIDREEGEGVFCYTTLKGDKNNKLRKVYGETVSRGFVQEYMGIFSEIGIQLKGIYSSEGVLIKLVELTAAELRKTFVVQVADDNLLTSVVWVNGSFYYYSSQRCFQDIGSPEYFDECSRSLGQLNQFMKANQIESPVETIYIGGMTQENADFYLHTVANGEMDAGVEIFDCGISINAQMGEDVHAVLMALAGLIGQERESNFLTNYSVQKSGTSGQLKKRIFLVASVFIVMLLLFIASFVWKLSVQNQLDDIEFQNTDPMQQAQMMYYELLSYEVRNTDNKLKSMQNIGHYIETYPVFTSEVIAKLEDSADGYAEIEISSFDAESGIIRFTVSAEEVEDINQYIAKLMEMDLFNSVDYTGYSYNDSEGLWDVHVSCILAEGVGR